MRPDEQARLETRRLPRFLTMAGLAGGLLADKAMGRSGESRLSPDAAKRIAEALGRLKGPLLKMGQSVSYLAEHLPPEVSAIMAQLQNNVPAMGYFFVAKQVERDLGGPVEKFFRSFERQAFAAASLGQVHRAVLKDGTPVAVKVQYPDMATLVDSDLKTAKLLVDGLRLSAGADYDVTAMFAEARTRIIEELDYRKEAANARHFARHFASDPSVRIPEVYPEASGERVLTMALMPGMTLGQSLAQGLHQDERDHYGRLLLKLFWEAYFGLGALHADPHPGNYLLHEGTVTLLDFGCVTYLSAPWREASLDMLQGVIGDDEQALRSGYLRGGYLREGDSAAKFAALKATSQALFAAYREETYDFSQSGQVTKGLQVMRDYGSEFGIRLPPEAVFVHRAAGGILAALFQLKAKGRYRELLAPYLAGR